MIAGNSRTHGGHQLAQKLTTTTLPLRSSTSARICFAFTLRTSHRGAPVGSAEAGLACFVAAVEARSRSRQPEATIANVQTAAAAHHSPANRPLFHDLLFASMPKVACLTLSKPLGPISDTFVSTVRFLVTRNVLRT